MEFFSANRIGASEIVAIITTALAILSFLTNLIIVSEQRKLHREGLRLQADAALTAWSNSCIDEISKAIDFVENWPKSKNDKAHSNLRWRLSSLIDQGRIHFPNRETREYLSQNDWSRNPGHRDPALDAVAFSYFVVRDIELTKEAHATVADFLRECRRLFYTEIQKTVDPYLRRKILERSGLGAQNPLQDELVLRMNDILPGVLKRLQSPPNNHNP